MSRAERKQRRLDKIKVYKEQIEDVFYKAMDSLGEKPTKEEIVVLDKSWRIEAAKLVKAHPQEKELILEAIRLFVSEIKEQTQMVRKHLGIKDE